MIIFLLDRSKELKLVNGNLFLRSSYSKSIDVVLKELSRLLLPSIVDIGRLLGRLSFDASNVQYPLSEYDCRVENLVTQFCDGVRSTRLVEFLLYSPQTFVCRNEDFTVTMPTGEILTMPVNGQQSRVLSQHLKFPCLGKSQKLYNVQLALNALQGIEPIVENVTADDFVDSHGEKTLVTLWGLSGIGDWAPWWTALSSEKTITG